MYSFYYIILSNLIHTGYTYPLYNHIHTELIGGCESTAYGCCLDNTTACQNFNCPNCNATSTHTYNTTNLIGGCESTAYGCCLDNTTACQNFNCTNCNSTHKAILRRRGSVIV